MGKGVFWYMWTVKIQISLGIHVCWSEPFLFNHKTRASDKEVMYTSSRLLCQSYCRFVVLRFYSPVNPVGSWWAWSVYLTTLLLCRLSPLSGYLFILSLMSLSTIFQSYHSGVWMWQGAQCSLLECCLSDILWPRHFDMIFQPVTLYWHWADQF